MNNRHRRTSSMKKRSTYDHNDIEAVRARLELSEQLVQQLTKENEVLVQETEKQKYNILMKTKELEEQVNNKSTELRRQNIKTRTLERDFKRNKNTLADERRRNRETAKQLESVARYLYSSFSFSLNSFLEVKRTFKETLLFLGWVKQEEDTN